MAIGWKGETRGRSVDKGVKGLLSHSRHSKRMWCGLQFAMESSEEARGSAQGGTSNPLETILAAITSSQRETRELRAKLRAA